MLTPIFVHGFYFWYLLTSLVVFVVAFVAIDFYLCRYFNYIVKLRYHTYNSSFYVRNQFHFGFFFYLNIVFFVKNIVRCM